MHDRNSVKKSQHGLWESPPEKDRKCLFDIKDLTLVRGQDGKISDTQGKDFWSPTRLCRVGDQ